MDTTRCFTIDDTEKRQTFATTLIRAEGDNMDQIKQMLDELEQQHKDQVAQLRQQHADQMLSQEANYEAKIKALRTRAGIERELQIQNSVFERHVLSDLCSLVMRNYDPVKYPPNMYNLLSALAKPHENEDADRLLPATAVVGLEPATGARQVSYHQVAAFRDAIFDGLKVIGASMISKDKSSAEQGQQNELQQFRNFRNDVQRKHDMATRETKRLRKAVGHERAQAQKEHALLLECIISVAEHLDLVHLTKEQVVTFFEDLGCPASTVRVLHESRLFASLWLDTVAGHRHINGARVSVKREFEEDSDELGRNVKLKTEHDGDTDTSGTKLMIKDETG